MGWHGVATATPRQQDSSFLPPLGIFLKRFIFTFALLLQRESLILSYSSALIYVTFWKVKSFPAHNYQFDCNDIVYEISPQILYHVVTPREFCHPCNTGLATGLELHIR